MALATERQAPAANDAEIDDDEEELFTRPKPAANGTAKEPAADPEDAPLTPKERREMNKRIKDADARAEENRRNADFWASRASQAAPPPAREKKEPEPDMDDAALMEEFTRSPTAFMKKMAKQMGFITKGEQEQYLADNLSTFGQGIMKRIGTDRALLKEFPDLDDPTSDFAKRTMEIVEELTEGDARKRTTFFKAAAKIAKQEFAMKGKRRARPAGDEDDEDMDDDDQLDMGDAEEETPAERRSRIARQGPRGGRSTRSLVDSVVGGGVMQTVFDQFDIKPERRNEVMKKIKVARKNAITEGM